MSRPESGNQDVQARGRYALGLWLTGITVLALGLFILAMPYIRQGKSVRWVRAQGGHVDTEATWLTTRLPNAAKTWLSARGWLEKVEHVTSVEFGYTKVGDTGLEHLRGLSNLRLLSFHSCQLTDVDLKHLEGLTILQGLSLTDNTQVTDAGLVHLKGMTFLQFLSLDGTRVSDAGLVHLKGMTFMQSLSLKYTQVGDAGLEHLKGMPILQQLDISRTNVSDVGLEHLKGMTSLQLLFLGRSGEFQHGEQTFQLWDIGRITQAGEDKLKAALPSLRIIEIPIED